MAALTQRALTENAGFAVIDRIQRSQLFRDYQQAFEATTGLPLVLRKPNSFQTPLHGSRRLNPFCALMAGVNKPCAACLELQQRVEAAAVRNSATLECYAGLSESTVPVRIGNKVLGYLQTGQVFLRKPSKKQFDEIVRNLPVADSGIDLKEVESRYFKTRVISRQHYASIVRLLTIFADHLASVSNQMMIRDSIIESPAITRVRRFIAEHQSEELSLAAAARSVNMSECYFCKLFKRATGLTFTSYLARLRIESVKSRLLNAHVHVSEAAFAAGFQSLSQFNRVFRRITGESPSEYRHRIHGDGAPGVVGRPEVHAA
jgi:AraC-like DNA-binding protein/ligand-binding sensor protein